MNHKYTKNYCHTTRHDYEKSDYLDAEKCRICGFWLVEDSRGSA